MGMAYIRLCPTCPLVRAARGHARAHREFGSSVLINYPPFVFLSGSLCAVLESQKHQGHGNVHLQDEVR